MESILNGNDGVEWILAELARLAKPGDFWLRNGTHIRSMETNKDGWQYCPICWLAKETGGNTDDYSVEIDKVYIPVSEAPMRRIASVADFDWNDQGLCELRQRLLIACKLAG